MWQKNKDYEKICPGTPASPTLCAAGCYTNKLWNEFKEECLPDIKDMKNAASCSSTTSNTK